MLKQKFKKQIMVTFIRYVRVSVVCELHSKVQNEGTRPKVRSARAVTETTKERRNETQSERNETQSAKCTSSD